MTPHALMESKRRATRCAAVERLFHRGAWRSLPLRTLERLARTFERFEETQDAEARWAVKSASRRKAETP